MACFIPQNIAMQKKKKIENFGLGAIHFWSTEFRYEKNVIVNKGSKNLQQFPIKIWIFKSKNKKWIFKI